MYKFAVTFAVLLIIILGLSYPMAMAQRVDIDVMRDSLDKINIALPEYKEIKADSVILIQSQEEWNNLGNTIKNELRKGYRNIEVKVTVKSLVYGEKMQGLEGLNYPDANIRIQANKTSMIPSGPLLKKNCKAKKGMFCVYPYTEFDINDIVIGVDNKPLSFYSECFQIETPIEEVVEEGTIDVKNTDGTLYKTITKVWRFKTDLPDLKESDCKDFYILLTRHWTSMRHQVMKIKNGYLYFYLKSEEAPSLYQMVMDPNSDTKHYRTFPRCRYFNCPVSNDIHIKGDSIYIPKRIKQVRIGKGARLFSVVNSKFKSFDLCGFYVKGAGNLSCVFLYNSTFSDQCWVRDNLFENMSGSTMYVQGCENVCIYNNSIQHTRKNAITCYGNRITIWNNNLKDIGFMYNTMAISFGGTDIHIIENIIEDFNYSGIACGGTSGNNNTPELTYIMEHNVIRHSKDFATNYLEHTVADGGGIYIGPQNTRGIIRNNVIQNITGIHSNRGIFLDDGAKNLFIYGNYVTGTANSYDIDLRYCTTYSAGIPDHNTNNVIIQNVMTGSYRFEEREDSKSCIVGENVILNGDKKELPSKIAIKRKASDRKEVSNTFKIDEFVKKYITL